MASLIDKKYTEAVAGINDLMLQDMEKWYQYIAGLPTDLQVVYTVMVYYQQIHNGGLHQYYFNPYGMFVFLTIENLKKINAMKSLEILSSSLEKVNQEGLSEEEFRERVFNRQIDAITEFDDELGDILDELDSEFYESEEDVIGLLEEYLKR